MAKKGQALQLQTEINDDDEWEKFLQRDGLIVVDIYSDWCGPCQGMAANLKKLKLEIGGDMLQLAVAKSDGIEALKRFRNKSEPTWMFISHGKMVNLMFGADAPKLTRLIVSELNIEKISQENQKDRGGIEVTEMAEEEQERYEVVEAVAREIREKEATKKAQELLDRRTTECENILANYRHFGTVIIFPHAKDRYKEVLNEVIDEAGLLVSSVEKIKTTREKLEELLYFSEEDEEFSEESIEELTNDEFVIISLKSAKRSVEIDNMDLLIAGMVYGESKKPPGSPNSPAMMLYNMKDEEGVPFEKVSIWVPLTEYMKATVLKLFFPKLTANYVIPEPEPEPPYIAIVIDSAKIDDALQIIQKYPKQIARYGFFTTENPEDTELVAKTYKKLEKLGKERTFSEKLVMQVVETKSECVFAFAQLGANYMSPNSSEGLRECKLFFPEDYDEEEEEEEIEEVIVPSESQELLYSEVKPEEEVEKEHGEEAEHEEGAAETEHEAKVEAQPGDTATSPVTEVIVEKSTAAPTDSATPAQKDTVSTAPSDVAVDAPTDAAAPVPKDLSTPAPENVAPELVATAPLTPETVAPESVTPAPVAPEPVAPAPVAPEPIVPAPVAPEPVVPALVVPEPVASEPVAPEPITPEPVAPAPVTPEPVAPAPMESPMPTAPAEPAATEHAAPVSTEPAAPSPTEYAPEETPTEG